MHQSGVAPWKGSGSGKWFVLTRSVFACTHIRFYLYEVFRLTKTSIRWGLNTSAWIIFFALLIIRLTAFGYLKTFIEIFKHNKY